MIYRHFQWKTGIGERLHVYDMDIEHIKNILKWIPRNGKKANSSYSGQPYSEWVKVFKEELKFRNPHNGGPGKKLYTHILWKLKK